MVVMGAVMSDAHTPAEAVVAKCTHVRCVTDLGHMACAPCIAAALKDCEERLDAKHGRITTSPAATALSAREPEHQAGCHLLSTIHLLATAQGQACNTGGCPGCTCPSPTPPEVELREQVGINDLFAKLRDPALTNKAAYDLLAAFALAQRQAQRKKDEEAFVEAVYRVKPTCCDLPSGCMCAENMRSLAMDAIRATAIEHDPEGA